MGFISERLERTRRSPPPPCDACGCTKTRHLVHCPLCGAELPGRERGLRARWVRAGVMEVAVFTLVAAILVVSWLVVWSHH